tara:strand:- start:6077 stop:6367 length:291 start_codon:yes stop_codon:yes gene_type:complete
MADYSTAKFQNGITEALHKASMDGCDEEIGSVTEPPMEWYGLLINSGVESAAFAILSEDTQGFVTSLIFDSEEEVRMRWAIAEEEIRRWAIAFDIN